MLTIPGTDYRIRYDEEELPGVITQMTPVIKKKRVRYGDIIFLDVQMR